MVKQYSPAKFCGRVDIHAKNLAANALYIVRRWFAPPAPKPMRNPVWRNRHKPLVIQNWIYKRRAGRVARLYRGYVVNYVSARCLVVGKRVHKYCVQVVLADCVPAELARKPHAERFKQVAARQYHFVYKPRKQRLARGYLRRLLSDCRPYGVDASLGIVHKKFSAFK